MNTSQIQSIPTPYIWVGRRKPSPPKDYIGGCGKLGVITVTYWLVNGQATDAGVSSVAAFDTITVGSYWVIGSHSDGVTTCATIENLTVSHLLVEQSAIDCVSTLTDIPTIVVEGLLVTNEVTDLGTSAISKLDGVTVEKLLVARDANDSIQASAAFDSLVVEQ